MGKRIIQQRRGKGSFRYKALGWRAKARASHPSSTQANGTITGLISCPYHSAPLAKVTYGNGEENYIIAPEGLRVGAKLVSGNGELVFGNSLALKDIPEGTLVYNIEAMPGDGGKFIRSAGAFGKVISKIGGKVTILLPSKKERQFSADCRASIGIVAGGGKLEKPLLKAGNAYHKFKASNKLWPKVSGTSMNAVDHPFGGTSSAHKGKPTVAPKNAPPGRKVGKVRPRRTGKQK